jgi:polyisoprenoid-binding protein YceI
VAALVGAAGCTKREDKPATPPATPTTETKPADKPSDPPPPPATASADWVKVYAEHAEKKPEDPAEITFDKITYKSVKLGANNAIEGGSASFSIDVASIKSDSPKRDDHLKTADYLDLSKYTSINVDVTNVKKVDTKYTADAKVSYRDLEKTYPVTFEVVEQGADFVTIKGEQAIARKDFNVGGQPDKSVADALTVKLQLTLKPTGA